MKIKNKERIENKNFKVKAIVKICQMEQIQDILKGKYKIIKSDKSRTRPLQSSRRFLGLLRPLDPCSGQTTKVKGQQ